MMNKSKIEWCDFTWNPVTGCQPWMLVLLCGKAGVQIFRKCDDQQGFWTAEKEKWPVGAEKPFKNEAGKVTPFPVKFEPLLHEYRLSMPEQKRNRPLYLW